MISLDDMQHADKWRTDSIYIKVFGSLENYVRFANETYCRSSSCYRISFVETNKKNVSGNLVYTTSHWSHQDTWYLLLTCYPQQCDLDLLPL